MRLSFDVGGHGKNTFGTLRTGDRLPPIRSSFCMGLHASVWLRGDLHRLVTRICSGPFPSTTVIGGTAIETRNTYFQTKKLAGRRDIVGRETHMPNLNIKLNIPNQVKQERADKKAGLTNQEPIGRPRQICGNKREYVD